MLTHSFFANIVPIVHSVNKLFRLRFDSRKQNTTWMNLRLRLMNYHFRSMQKAVWQPIKSLGIGLKTWQIFQTAPKYSTAGWEPLGRRWFLIKRAAQHRDIVVFASAVPSELGIGVPEVKIGCRFKIVFTTWVKHASPLLYFEYYSLVTLDLIAIL